MGIATGANCGGRAHGVPVVAPDARGRVRDAGGRVRVTGHGHWAWITGHGPPGTGAAAAVPRETPVPGFTLQSAPEAPALMESR